MSSALSGVTQTNAFNSIKAKENSQEMGKDEFLKLLVTQLKYQDPLKPMNNEQFIAQLAQFSTLESMNNMQSSFEGVQTYNLIGKRVVKVDPVTLEKTEGKVSGVKLESGKYYLILPNANSSTIDKFDVAQAFSATRIDINQYKDALFTKNSLSTNQYEWKKSIESLSDFSNALGYSSPADLPTPLYNLWDKEHFVEIPIDEVSFVYE